MMRRIWLALATPVSQAACGAENTRSDSPPEPLAETSPKRVARDFISLLPLTLTLEDYAKTEKISDLPRTLTKERAPAGSDPSVGDITYYSPWGNLAIF